MKTQGCKREQGFTLIEVLIAVMLVGVAFAALIAATGTLTAANGAGMTLSTAEFFVEQIRELTTTLPVTDPQTDTTTFGPEEASLEDYDDLDDLNGAVFSPPVDAGRNVLSDFGSFTQQVTVQNVSGFDFESVVENHSTSFVRVTVRVLYNGDEITSSSWIRARY